MKLVSNADFYFLNLKSAIFILQSKINYPLSDNLKISPKTPLAVTADPAPAP